MAGTIHEKALAAEVIGVLVVETADALSGANTGTFKLPDPSRYFATVIVFMMLAGAAMFGEKPGKLAATFGGVAAIGMIATPSKATGRAPVMGLLAYFNQLWTGGVQGSGGPTTTTIVPGPSNASTSTVLPHNGVGYTSPADSAPA